MKLNGDGNACFKTLQWVQAELGKNVDSESEFLKVYGGDELAGARRNLLEKFEQRVKTYVLPAQ